MSSDLSVEMTEMLEFVLIIYCSGSLIFSLCVMGNFSNSGTWSILGVILAIIHAALPMDKINLLIFKVKEAPPNQ